MRNCLMAAFAIISLINCNCKTDNKPSIRAIAHSYTIAQSNPFVPVKTDEETKGEVPVLCYHNFTENRNTDITLSRKTFEEQIGSLAHSGYHSVLPDDLYDHLTTGKPLPTKPIIISFDDTREAQYTIAVPIMEKYGFKGVFFIMTVCVDKKNYFSSAQIKDLSDRGHVIAAHTYDHPLISDIKGNRQWFKELAEPKALLEKIIQKHVDFFAYPYGSFTATSIAELKKYKYKGAFQLTGKKSDGDSVYSMRRLMVQGNWSLSTFHHKIAQTFH
jgi:peptidoglycan/xylan/chitin deacetylase (PgdA/CDA1 family)